MRYDGELPCGLATLPVAGPDCAGVVLLNHVCLQSSTGAFMWVPLTKEIVRSRRELSVVADSIVPASLRAMVEG